MIQWRGIINAGLAVALAMLLIWGFSPISTGGRTGLTVLILLTIVPAMVYAWRQHVASVNDNVLSSMTLPPDHFKGPVVLVAGDSDNFFAGRPASCEGPQGWYLHISTPEHYLSLIQRLAGERPGLLMHISVMLSLIPEQHTDEDTLRQMLTAWQRVVVQSRRWISHVPPLWLCCWLNPPCHGPDIHWLVRSPQDNEVQIGSSIDDLTPFSTTEVENRQSHLSHAVWLDSLLDWIAGLHTQPADAGLMNIISLRVMCFTQVKTVKNNLWQRQVVGQTTLLPAECSRGELLPFPDIALPFLSRRQTLGTFQRMAGISSMLCGLFLGLAMICSFINNQHLLHIIDDHLKLYYRLEGNPSEPKIQAQEQLRRDLQQLEQWYRQGEPVSLSIGLYQGMRLISPLRVAISDWAAPVVTKQLAPKAVRLDSMSLFDTGQWALKPGSAKILINALVNIKAKPGWLIVVAGHTDNVGNELSNQQLSLKRAESVRNWMRDTGDVPESCFAVQGYGKSRPWQTNDTPEGRAANRRVEISLVPQADACRVPGMREPSPEGGGAIAK